jgi:Transposase domain (DUF772)
MPFKHMHDLSDEVLCERWLENPYDQLFCGEEFFCHKLPYRSDIFTVTQVNVTALIQISLVSGVLGALLLLYTSNAVFIRLVPWLLQVRLAAMPTIFAEAGAC